jgi:hypothetical protein
MDSSMLSHTASLTDSIKLIGHSINTQLGHTFLVPMGTLALETGTTFNLHGQYARITT